MNLNKLRTFAGELGYELIYMIGQSKTLFIKVNHSNFSPRKNIGLSKDGELFLLPITPDALSSKLSLAVGRQKKRDHTTQTQKAQGVKLD